VNAAINPPMTLISDAVNADAHLSAIKQQCLQGSCTEPLYQVKNEMLYWRQRLVVPPSPSLIQTILQEFHSSMLGGHSGIARTKAHIASQFTWPSMSKDIPLFVTNCLVCQQAKASTAAPAGFL
jgi:hypothetical protein